MIANLFHKGTQGTQVDGVTPSEQEQGSAPQGSAPQDQFDNLRMDDDSEAYHRVLRESLASETAHHRAMGTHHDLFR